VSARYKDFIIGLTVIIGLLGVAVLLMVFGELELTRPPTYRLVIHLDQAAGLSTASDVTLNGVSVGAIERIDTDPDPRSGVRIGILIREPHRVPRDARVHLERGLVGESTLALRTRPLVAGAADPGFLNPDETLSATAVGMFDEIGGIIDRRLQPFAEAAESLEELSRAWTRVGELGQDLLSPRSASEVDAGSSPPNIASLLSRFDQAAKAAQGWLGDDSLRDDVRAAASRLMNVLDEAGKAFSSLAGASESVSREAEKIGGEVGAAARDFATASRAAVDAINEMQTLVGRVNQGEGTLGQLAQNPDLYRSFTDAVQRLEKALTEGQLLLEKYRTEGLPIKF